MPASAIRVASAEPVPSGLKSARWWRSAPTSSDNPTMPLMLIMIAAKTVSRARPEVSLSPVIISVTISATSMTVTATAKRSDPNGSPTLWATTSAWCTAASTAPIRNAAMTGTSGPARSRPQVATSRTMPRIGAQTVQLKRPRTVDELMAEA